MAKRVCDKHYASRQATDINGNRYCKSCNNTYSKEYQKTRREQYRNNEYLRRYGITVEQYNTLLEQQNGVCAICLDICHVRKNLAVDHDPKTGKVRGLLCFNCNVAIGKLEHDEELLMNAIAYLRGKK